MVCDKRSGTFEEFVDKKRLETVKKWFYAIFFNSTDDVDFFIEKKNPIWM